MKTYTVAASAVVPQNAGLTRAQIFDRMKSLYPLVGSAKIEKVERIDILQVGCCQLLKGDIPAGLALAYLIEWFYKGKHYTQAPQSGYVDKYGCKTTFAENVWRKLTHKYELIVRKRVGPRCARTYLTPKFGALLDEMSPVTRTGDTAESPVKSPVVDSESPVTSQGLIYEQPTSAIASEERRGERASPDSPPSSSSTAKTTTKTADAPAAHTAEQPEASGEKTRGAEPGKRQQGGAKAGKSDRKSAEPREQRSYIERAITDREAGEPWESINTGILYTSRVINILDTADAKEHIAHLAARSEVVSAYDRLAHGAAISAGRDHACRGAYPPPLYDLLLSLGEKGAPKSNPWLVLLCGKPGSSKSTLVNDVACRRTSSASDVITASDWATGTAHVDEKNPPFVVEDGSKLWNVTHLSRLTGRMDKAERLLVLDDVHAWRMGSPKARDVFTAMLRARYDLRRPVVMITNEDPVQTLEDLAGGDEAMLSRLMMGTVIRMETDEDLRTVNNKITAVMDSQKDEISRLVIQSREISKEKQQEESAERKAKQQAYDEKVEERERQHPGSKAVLLAHNEVGRCERQLQQPGLQPHHIKQFTEDLEKSKVALALCEKKFNDSELERETKAVADAADAAEHEAQYMETVAAMAAAAAGNTSRTATEEELKAMGRTLEGAKPPGEALAELAASLGIKSDNSSNNLQNILAPSAQPETRPLRT